MTSLTTWILSATILSTTIRSGCGKWSCLH